jgi:hypothetical protein
LPSKLREDFKHDTDGDYRAVAQEDQARTFAAWMEEIQKAAAFKYTPTAEEASRPESREEGPAPFSEDADY